MGKYDYNIKRYHDIKKINYVKKPFARNSLICVATLAAALVLCAASLYFSVSSAGEGGLNVAAWAVSSMLFTITSLVYGGISFYEDDKNYLLAKIGMVFSGLLLIFWICMVIVGIRVQ